MVAIWMVDNALHNDVYAKLVLVTVPAKEKTLKDVIAEF